MSLARRFRSLSRRARWRLIEVLASRRVVHVRGLSFELQSDNWITQFRADTFETKEPETLDWIDRHMRVEDLFFDVGGNIGVFTLYAALRHPRASVVTFEPEYANLHLLRDNIVANRLIDRVQVYPIALSDRTGVSRLHVQDLTPGSALHTESTTPIPTTESGERVVLSEGTWAMALDDFCEQARLWPNVIKIDVDGGEARVLAGARHTLAGSGFHSLIVETGGAGLGPEARALLGSSGLRRIDLPRPSEAGNEVWVR